MGCTPLGGPARIHGHHRDPPVGGHLDQPIPELPGRDAGHQSAEPSATTPATKGLPTDLPHVGEVEVFDADGGAAPLLGNL
jgi:hypothetical protein